jgi:4-carboxymuconolactone decarboxylase
VDDAELDQLFRDVLASEPPTWSGPYPYATRDHVIGEVWTRPGLSIRDRRLVSLACVASAAAPVALETHVHAAFATGDVSLEEMLEVVLQFAVYNGWARASYVEGVVRMQWVRLCQERGEEVGPWPETPDPAVDVDDPDALRAAGVRTYTEVLGTAPPSSGGVHQASEVLGFAYARVWSRPALARRDRRLLTLPWAAIHGGAATVLRHVEGALASGDLSAAELDEVVVQTSAYGGLLVGERLDDAVRAAVAGRG